VMTLNVTAQATMIAAFDSMLRASAAPRVIGITSSVGADPRAYWGGYGASKAAFENLLLTYADETSTAGRLRVAIVDPGATRTAMRAKAYPGEDPATLKGPEIVAGRIAALLAADFSTGHRERVN
jgi:NAD(P)-dependent dehydrogenase (short-subunit alcohol dehydrogenase family)